MHADHEQNLWLAGWHHRDDETVAGRTLRVRARCGTGFHEGVWVFDDELRTTYVNRRLAEMLGVAAEEMTGRSAFDFMDDASRAEVEQRWERRAQGLKEQ